MKIRIAFAALLTFCTAAFAQATYVAEIDDLPLMPGLAQPAGGTTQLDEPDGRIVEANAAGLVTADAIAKYYASALPQLGWRHLDAAHYARDGESLTIEATAEPPGASVKFSLRPDPSQGPSQSGETKR